MQALFLDETSLLLSAGPPGNPEGLARLIHDLFGTLRVLITEPSLLAALVFAGVESTQRFCGTIQIEHAR